MAGIATVEAGIDISSLSEQIDKFGKQRLSDVFGDRLIYRSLEPLEKKVPGLKKAAGKMQLLNDRIPRKDEPDYARASMWFMNYVQNKRGVSAPISELLYIGDSAYSDGQAYQNLLELSNWKCSGFIGYEQVDEPSKVDMDGSGLCTSNRWAGLLPWAQWMLSDSFSLGQSTAVIVDIDKTLIGAKGRNDHVIDKARLEGIYRTMDVVLGDSFDRAAFERQYAELNQADYHVVTADNQDYIAYVCLVLNAKLLQLDELIGEVQEDRIDNFEQFVRWVNTRLMINPAGGERLRQVHEAVMMSFMAGDPTPFKRLRKEEFQTTTEHMGNTPSDSSLSDILENEITITKEVLDMSAWLIERGCLVYCMSDKPDESACPDRHLADEFLPIHEIETHCVGCNIREQLNVL